MAAGKPSGLGARTDEGWVYAVQFLPDPPDKTGQTDYTREIQAAIDAAAGKTLLLPDFPILTSQVSGGDYCLIAKQALYLFGTRNSELRTQSDNSILLLVDSTDPNVRLEDVYLEGICFRGNGTASKDVLGKGLVQINHVDKVRVERVTVRDGDVDGLALHQCSEVRVIGCTMIHNAKSSIYPNNSQDVIVEGNTVRGFGGYISNGHLLGTGIALSSNDGMICVNNQVYDGTGVGINVFTVIGVLARNYVISGNVVRNIKNPQNTSHAAGINMDTPVTSQNTVVAQNLVTGCGNYNFRFANQTGVLLAANLSANSLNTNVSLLDVKDSLLQGNLLLNSGTENLPGQYAVSLAGTTDQVWVRNNYIRNPCSATAFGTPAIIDFSAANGEVNLMGQRAFLVFDGTQSLPNDQWTPVAFGTVVEDPLLLWDAAKTGFVIRQGITQVTVTANAAFAAISSGSRSMALWVNGAPVPETPQVSLASGGLLTLNLKSSVFTVGANDLVQVAAFQDSGTSLDLLPGDTTWVELKIPFPNEVIPGR